MEFQHRFFREKAVQEYIQRQEKDFLPQFFAPHRVILAYLLLFIFLLAALLVWCGEVPFFITESGVVLPKEMVHIRGNEMALRLFLPTQYAARLHRGESVELQVEPAGQQFSSTIQSIESGIISPEEVRKQYMEHGGAIQGLTQSSVVVILQPDVAHMPHLSSGELVRVQIKIGSRHIF